MGACASSPPPASAAKSQSLGVRAKHLIELFGHEDLPVAPEHAAALTAALCNAPVSAALAAHGGVTEVERSIAEAELTADLLAFLLAEEARTAAGSHGSASTTSSSVAALSAWLSLLEAGAAPERVASLVQTLAAVRNSSSSANVGTEAATDIGGYIPALGGARSEEPTAVGINKLTV